MNKVVIEDYLELDYAINEAFKTLRTNLEFCGTDIKVVMLTSCTPNEGKSTILINLAKSIAEGGKKVIIIDADLRKSVLVGRHKIGKVLGLSHYLSGQKKLEEVIYDTNFDRLHTVFSGPLVPNPTELLGNASFEKMLVTLREEYDYIIIDAPPLGSVIDAAVIAPKCDGSILVIENSRISYRYVQNVKKQLEKTECKIVGSILNKVDLEGNSYYNGYYQGYYKGYYSKYYGND